MQHTMDIGHLIGTADSEFPALYQLFGGYFHQDWRQEQQSPDDVLDAFIADAPRDALLAAVAELDRLLALRLSAGELDRLLAEAFDCNYVPERDGVGSRQWLQHVRERLGAASSSA